MKVRLLSYLLVLVAVQAGLARAAVWQIWDNTSPYACNLSTGTATGSGNAYACSGSAMGDPAMAMTAWSTTGSGSTFAQASVQRWNWTYALSNPTDTPFNLAGQDTGYDYGVVNAKEDGSSPNHSMDNAGYTDFLSLNFTKAVTLTSLSIGWYSTDSDISILRYTGTTAPTISGKTVGNLVSSGWELVGHYANLHNDNMTPIRTVDISNASASSWWIVSAYNSSYGAATTAYGGSTSGLDGGNDYVKLLQVAGTVPNDNKTPEPGSMLLLGMGLVGMIALRRRMSRA